MQYFPGAECDPVNEYALESLKPEVRQRWLADHPLPDTIRYYSLATLPDEEQISAELKSSYRKLARVDARSDSQLIFLRPDRPRFDPTGIPQRGSLGAVRRDRTFPQVHLRPTPPV
ncbi:MAG: hypothetical protein LJE91_04460 [Gammaproteobacteria bacterium]|nr:hypothetical protein [Gammaproteobacteria bacterium]